MDNQDNDFEYQSEEADSGGVEEERPSRLRRGPVRAILVFLACVMIILLVWQIVPLWRTGARFWAKETEGHYEVHYEWEYQGSQWQYEANISKASYEYFSQRRRTADYREYVLNTKDDELMNDLAAHFSEQAAQQGWGQSDTVSFVLSFVQSMPYTEDEVTTGHDEYPRYPLETIVDGGGDCEDTAILFTSIVREMGYGVALLELEEDRHMAAGVLISQEVIDNWNQGYDLTYYAADGRNYAYCETTGEGWELGHKPEDLISTTVQVIDVS